MVCPSCRAEVTAGQRWCGICHTNVFRPELGKLASPARRLAAWMMDFFIPIVVFIMILSGSIAAGSVALFVLAFLGYMAWSFTLFTRGMTPGKLTMGIQVVKEDGRPAGFLTMFVRETIGKWISGLVFGLGWIWILIDKDRQGWHDKLVSTFVMQRATSASSTSTGTISGAHAPPPAAAGGYPSDRPAWVGTANAPLPAEAAEQSKPTMLAAHAPGRGPAYEARIAPPPARDAIPPIEPSGARRGSATGAASFPPKMASLFAPVPFGVTIYCGMCGHSHAGARIGEKCQRCGADLE